MALQVGLSAMVALTALLSMSDVTEAQTLSADEILTRTLDTYRSLRTYRDRGHHVTNHEGRWTQRQSRFGFITAFIRPGRFRLEFGRRNVIWANESSVTLSGPYLYRHPVSLDMAIAAEMSASGGVAYAIPALLLPEVYRYSSSFFSEHTSLRRLDDAPVDQAMCYQLAGDWGGRSWTVWIDHRTWLIRRIEEARSSDGTRSTTHYVPEGNEPVGETDLQEPFGIGLTSPVFVLGMAALMAYRIFVWFRGRSGSASPS